MHFVKIIFVLFCLWFIFHFSNEFNHVALPNRWKLLLFQPFLTIVIVNVISSIIYEKFRLPPQPRLKEWIDSSCVVLPLQCLHIWLHWGPNSVLTKMVQEF